MCAFIHWKYTIRCQVVSVWMELWLRCERGLVYAPQFACSTDMV